MVMTSLTTAAKAYNEGHQHAQFHLYGSTPDTGDVEEGTGLWWVVRSGSVIKKCEGLVFGLLTLEDGDIVYGQYVDSAGDEGGLASYTMVVTEAWDREYWVDATGGSDGNDGLSIGAPKQTIISAITAARTGWTSDDRMCINLLRGETFSTSTAGSSIVWAANLLGHICFRAYGDEGDPVPEIALSSSGNGTSFYQDFNGGLTGITCINVRVTGGYTLGGAATSSEFIRSAGTQSSSGTGANVALYNVHIDGVNFPIQGSNCTFANRGDNDFVALSNCLFENYREYALLAYDRCRYMLIQDTTFGACGSANGFVRGIGWSYVCFDNVDFDRSAVGSDTTNLLRLVGGAGSEYADSCHRVNCYKTNILAGATAGFRLDNTGIAGQEYYADIDFNACISYLNIASSLNYFLTSGGNADASNDVIRLRVRNCAHIGTNQKAMCDFSGTATGGTGSWHSWTLEHNTVVIDGDGAGIGNRAVGLVQFANDSGRVDAASGVVRNNYYYCTGTGTNGGCLMIAANAATTLAYCDYNVVRKAGGAVSWNDGTSLASWQGSTAFDDNSSEIVSSTHYLTDITASGFDPRPTSASIGTGLAGVAYIDADFHLYGNTPNVGAFQYGTTTEPDGPLEEDYTLEVQVGQIEWTANPISLSVSRHLSMQAGEIEWTGLPVTMVLSGEEQSEHRQPPRLGLRLGLGI